MDELLRINHLLSSLETVGRSADSRLDVHDLNLTAYFQDEIIDRLQSLMRIFEGSWR